MSVSEQENGAETLKKHSNVLVLEVGSLPTYTVATVRVLPFFLNVTCAGFKNIHDGDGLIPEC